MLTELTVRNLKPQAKMYRRSDALGLYLQVNPSGAKYWRYKYRIYPGGQMKEKALAIGTYPEVSLKTARELLVEARQLVANGEDPVSVRQQRKMQARSKGKDTFGAIGDDWFATRADTWGASHRKRQTRLLKLELAPLYALPIKDVKAPLLIDVIRRVEKRCIETGRRTNQVAGQVFLHGIALGVTEANPAPQIVGALRKPTPGHFAAVTDPKDLAAMLTTFDSYRGKDGVVPAALKLTPLLLVRPGELRRMEWSEIQFDHGVWTIPGSKMKRGRDHIVPLARQSLAVLKSLKPPSGDPRWVFPSDASGRRPISEAAVRSAMRRMGISKDEATPHGFRATARTLLAEVLEYPTDLIEHQLAHAVRDATGEAYNRTRFLDRRKTMMQEWADYLDSLRRPTTLRLVEPNDTRRRGA